MASGKLGAVHYPLLAFVCEHNRIAGWIYL